MNKFKLASTTLLILAMLSLFVVPLSASAQAHPLAGTSNAPALAQAATATPDPAMGMMEHPTSTPDPAMGMMEHPTASPGDAMMAPDASMANSSLPTTGAADNTILITLVGAAALLLLAGIGLRQAISRRS